MPKCPKCNRLFTADETLCSNCETELIEFDSSAFIVFKEVDKKPLAHKFVKFLHYSNIASAVYEYNKGNERWSILVQESDLKQTKKLYDAFYTVEKENALNRSKQKVTLQSTESTEHDTKEFDSLEDDLSENNSADYDSLENSSVEFDSTENSSAELDSTENNSVEFDSAENSSVEMDSVENSPVEMDSAENSPEKNDSAENTSVELDSVKSDSAESNSPENTSTQYSPVEETLEHDILLDKEEASEFNPNEANSTPDEEHPQNHNTEYSSDLDPEYSEIIAPEEESHLEEDFSMSDTVNEEDYLFDQEDIQDLYNDAEKKPEKTQTYVKKEEQYKDLISSAFSFLVISILGILILAINAMGIISIFNGTMTYVIMGGLFVFFLYVGIATLIKSKKVKVQIGEENQVTEAINSWLTQNITKESLNELVNPKDTDEVQFMQKIEQMKELVTKQFGELDDLYLDRITEEYYNNHFDE